jgi:hypothetical protein
MEIECDYYIYLNFIQSLFMSANHSFISNIKMNFFLLILKSSCWREKFVIKKKKNRIIQNMIK